MSKKYAFELITRFTSPNDSGLRSLDEIDFIAIHHWGDPNAGYSFEGVTAHLCNPNAKDMLGNPAPVSSHLVVTAGKVAFIVDLNRVAWHAFPQNRRTVGIECNPRCSNEDFHTVAQAIAYVWELLGRVVLLKGHTDLNPALKTDCPGRYYPRLKELYDLALKYYRGENLKETTNKPTQIKKGKKMLFIYLEDYATGSWKRSSGNLYAIVGEGFFFRFTGQDQANRFANQLGAAVKVTSSVWDGLAETARAGSNSPAYRDTVDADIKRIADVAEKVE